MTTKEYVFVVLKKCGYEVLLGVRHFLKDEEAPYEIIMDVTRK